MRCSGVALVPSFRGMMSPSSSSPKRGNAKSQNSSSSAALGNTNTNSGTESASSSASTPLVSSGSSWKRDKKEGTSSSNSRAATAGGRGGRSLHDGPPPPQYPPPSPSAKKEVARRSNGTDESAGPAGGAGDALEGSGSAGTGINRAGSAPGARQGATERDRGTSPVVDSATGTAGSDTAGPLSLKAAQERFISLASSGQTEGARKLLTSFPVGQRSSIANAVCSTNISPQGKTVGGTALTWAARWGHEQTVGFLLSVGARVEATDAFGRTPLRHAATMGQTKVVQLLVAAGADVTNTDSKGWSVLAKSAVKGQLAVVRVLLDSEKISTLQVENTVRKLKLLNPSSSTATSPILRILLHYQERRTKATVAPRAPLGTGCGDGGGGAGGGNDDRSRTPTPKEEADDDEESSPEPAITRSFGSSLPSSMSGLPLSIHFYSSPGKGPKPRRLGQIGKGAGTVVIAEEDPQFPDRVVAVKYWFPERERNTLDYIVCALCRLHFPRAFGDYCVAVTQASTASEGGSDTTEATREAAAKALEDAERRLSEWRQIIADTPPVSQTSSSRAQHEEEEEMRRVHLTPEAQRHPHTSTGTSPPPATVGKTPAFLCGTPQIQVPPLPSHHHLLLPLRYRASTRPSGEGEQGGPASPPVPPSSASGTPPPSSSRGSTSNVNISTTTPIDSCAVFPMMHWDLQKIINTPRVRSIPRKHIIRCVLEALCTLHSMGVVHRDVKPANVLLDDRLKDVRLCDFGTAAVLPGFTTGLVVAAAAPVAPDPTTDKKAQLRNPAGSIWYRAPEMHRKEPYNAAADIWSAGCLLGELIIRQPIFPGHTCADVLDMVQEAGWDLPSSVTGSHYGRAVEKLNSLIARGDSSSAGARSHAGSHGHSGGASSGTHSHTGGQSKGAAQSAREEKDLLHRMLTVDPAQRPTAKECLAHPFFLPLSTS